MRTIGSYELKTHLAEILASVEHGQTIVVTRRGKPIARITPNAEEKRERVKQAAKGIREFARTPLPKGVTIRTLVQAGRR